MLVNNYIIILLIISIDIIFFVLGYLVGLYNQHSAVVTNPKRINKNTPQQLSEIEIDNRKLVVDINTNNLEKKYDTLGDKTQTQETISSSVNKLKSMKG